MIIEANFIAGMMLGFEFVQPEDEECKYLVVDIFFVRFLFIYE